MGHIHIPAPRNYLKQQQDRERGGRGGSGPGRRWGWGVHLSPSFGPLTLTSWILGFFTCGFDYDFANYNSLPRGSSRFIKGGCSGNRVY